MFGRATAALFILAEDRQGIAAVAVEGSNLWIVASKTLQKWQLGNETQKVRSAPPHGE
jgi:nuclear pore complex protein Nup133